AGNNLLHYGFRGSANPRLGRAAGSQARSPSMSNDVVPGQSGQANNNIFPQVGIIFEGQLEDL
ncbi:hypothetical protein V6O07_14915, partial [Arthrospira platensis SPKY2]